MPARKIIAIVGGGPAGLMAAERVCGADVDVRVFDSMPSVGRKFLMAGKGGMNITHSEAMAEFRTRYGVREHWIAPLLNTFGPESVRAWMQGLGIASFVGSSGRVFPVGMKAAPLLRAWLHRLRASGVRLHVRHRWCGFARLANGRYRLHFEVPDGEQWFEADGVVLALGGGSWAKLGSDGRWVPAFEEMDVPVAPLRPANCGFNVEWSEFVRTRFSGQPLKSVAAFFFDSQGKMVRRQGECVITQHGIEGGLIYAFSAHLRDTIAQDGEAILQLDLLPGHDVQRVFEEVARPRGSRSLSSHLQSRLGLHGVKMALLYECLQRQAMDDPHVLATTIKGLPLRLLSPRPLDEAISSAGGVLFEALDDSLMLRDFPGVFCAGEMLDWEAPTGGYLLTACLASGHVAGQALSAWLRGTTS